MFIKPPANERIKEINCLYNVTKIIVDQKKSVQQTFQDIVGCLPPAWQYPEITCARIVLKDQEYVSADFKKTSWKQAASIFNDQEKVGTVEVYYLKKMPVIDEGPFLKEERMLVDTVAGHITDAYKKIKLENALKERIKELHCFYGVSRIIEKHNSDHKKILKGIVNLLPKAWQYPKITCAKIIFKNEEFKTENYMSSPWKQIADITIGNQASGFIEVAYTKEMPELDDGPFLKEERLLINSVAERISNALKRIKTEEELQVERISLENKNIALKEIIERVQVEKDETAKNVQANVDKIILPILTVIEQNTHFKDAKLINLLKKNLQDVTAPFTKSISNKFTTLSPVEIQICDYIKNGFSTKDIAQMRRIAVSTVSRHREHIRKKLNLTNKNINLVTYLNNFMN